MFSNHGTLTCRAEPKAPAEARSYSGRGPGYDKIADIHKPHCRYLAMCVKKWLTALARAVPAGALSYLRKAPAGGRQEGKPSVASFNSVTEIFKLIFDP